MTTRQEIERKVNTGYFDVYLQRRLPDGSYETDWTDISRYVTGGSRVIDRSLDGADYDIGIFTISSVELVFNNQSGKFNDVGDSRSLWSSLESRHLSKVRIEAGYRDRTTLAKIEEIVFDGLLNEQATTSNSSDDVSMTVMALEYAFKTLDVPFGTFDSPVTVAQAILSLCSRGEVLAHMTVSAANINPSNNVTLDAPSTLGGRKLDEVLKELLLISNSVMAVNSAGALVVTGRAPPLAVAYDFRLNATTRKGDNVYRISNMSNGRHRVKNVFVWSSNEALTAASSGTHLSRYGVTRKSVASSAVTVTGVIQTVLNGLRDEWQFPKRELEVETDYLANEVALFDLVTLDFQPTLDRDDSLPVCGTAVAGADRCAMFASGLWITPDIGFKVIGIRHDLAGYKTSLKVREKGTTLTDGYLPMLLSKNVALVFTAVATMDLDVSAYGMNAQKCMVEVLDSATEYETNELDVRRPTSAIVRFTAGAAITKTFRILLTQVED